MPKIVTIAQMQAIEAAAAQGGLAAAMMMEYAGRAVARVVLERVSHAVPHYAVVLCGGGHNGGDGLVAAFHLAEAGITVVVYATHPLDETDPKVLRLRRQGVRLMEAASDLNWLSLQSLLAKATLVVDAVLGTGARLPVRGLPAVVLQYTGQFLATRARPVLRVAVDCPSGLHCDTGALDPVALPADVTVTFGAAKIGQVTFPGAAAVGALVIDDIGLPPNLPALAGIPLELATRAQIQALQPARPRDAHKGTFGRVLAVVGSVNYTGAAYLAGAAAYRIGAGLVSLAVPEPLYPVLAGHLPEATWLPLPTQAGTLAAQAAPAVQAEWPKTQALLLGPGWGVTAETTQLLDAMLQTPAAQWPPTVIDADGLKTLATFSDWPQRLRPNCVLTPHLGEMSILTGLEKATVQAERVAVAQRFAAQWGQVVVLKGAFTIIAAPDGRTTLLPFATAALARAGTGDVLAGAIAGLLAQGLPPYEAALVGGYVQGRAGELAAQHMGTTTSVLAGDVLASLPAALRELAN